jgi:hypothetical protein
VTTGEGRAPIEAAIEAAAALGIELDRGEAERWIAEIANEAAGSVSVDVDSGVYGHRVTMADYDPADLARFRRIAAIVGLDDRPPHIATALALSGSAAQSRIQRFPGDCDFFERVHIRAATREEACARLADLMRETALERRVGAGHRLKEVKFGSWPYPAVVDGEPVAAGSSVSWTPAALDAGFVAHDLPAGGRGRLTWAEAGAEPGWCKLDWVVADAERGTLSKASNMLDVTWEAPDGSITPLDGFLDPYFQEVYLETESIPLFSRLVKEMGADAVAEYVERLEDEVYKYTVKTPNYGKAARRLYNVLRLTGRYGEAAYVRELFDEPVTVLYQVAALLETLDEAHDDDFAVETLVAQVDGLIMSAISALEGRQEAEMVARLLRCRDAIAARAGGDAWAADRAGVMTAAMDEVNAYFRRALTDVPTIAAHLESISARRGR